MNTFINPFTDFGFKKLFGQEASKDMLISFLNEILKSYNETILDITLLNTEQIGRQAGDRKSFFDIHCKNEKGDYFIVEIQRIWHKHFLERMIFYSSFPIQDQSDKGDWDYDLKAIYVIALLEFEISEKQNLPKKLLTKGRIYDEDTLKVLYSKLTYIFISLNEFSKSEDQLESLLDKWLFLLKNMNKFESYPSKIKEMILMKFLEKAEVAQLNEKERAQYEYSLKVYWTENAIRLTREEEDRERERINREREKIDRERERIDREREQIDRERMLLDIENEKIKMAFEENKIELNQVQQEVNQLKEELNESLAESSKMNIQFIKNSFNEGISVETISKITGVSVEKIRTLIQ